MPRAKPALPSSFITSSRNERESNRVLTDKIGADKAERRLGAGEVRFPAAEHKWTNVQIILVDETEAGKTRRQIRPRNGDDAVNFRLQMAHEPFEIVTNERGVGAERLQRA